MGYSEREQTKAANENYNSVLKDRGGVGKTGISNNNLLSKYTNQSCYRLLPLRILFLL